MAASSALGGARVTLGGRSRMLEAMVALVGGVGVWGRAGSESEAAARADLKRDWRFFGAASSCCCSDGVGVVVVVAEGWEGKRVRRRWAVEGVEEDEDVRA